MNRVNINNQDKLFIDGIEIKNVSSFKRYFDMHGHGVQIAFYTNHVNLNRDDKMTKTEAENSIKRILKQYEQDNNVVVDTIEIVNTNITDIGSPQKTIRRLFIQEISFSRSDWDI